MPQSQHAENDLQDARENYRGEDQANVARQRRKHAGEYDDHRAGRTRDLGARAAEQRRKESDEDSAVDAGHGAGARRLAECKGKRQCNDAGREAAVDVAAQIA